MRTTRQHVKTKLTTPGVFRSLPLALLLAAIACAPEGFAQGQPVRTVVLVRHAERDGGMGDEAGINQAGRCRAEGLARILADAGIRTIYTSEVARTQQTAAPLAKKLGIQPEVIPAKDVEGLVKRLRSAPEHGAALVVSHSNRIPEIIERLGAGTVAPIGDAEYDRLFIVTMHGSQAQVVMLHYPGCAN